jgi:hypothetical protein
MFRVLFAPIIRSTTAAYSHRLCICGKTEVLVSSGVEVYFIWICVYSFFEVSCYILCAGVCVSLDVFCYSVVMMCDLFADSFYATFVYLRFGQENKEYSEHLVGHMLPRCTEPQTSNCKH